MDEGDNHPPSALLSSEDKLHLSNIQFLAAVDCALALTSLIFNTRQLILAIGDSSSTNPGLNDDTDGILDGNDASNTLQVRLIVAAVASVCLTLTQLLFACLMMTFSSHVIIYAYNLMRHHLRRRTYITRVWVCWSGVLLVILIICTFNIKRFESIADKFYLFVLLSEIVFRVVIILYTCLFYLCKASTDA